MKTELLHEYHVPRHGYRKIWPTTRLCPICQAEIIYGPGVQRALYIPKDHRSGLGDRICIYVCARCYKICGPSKSLETISSVIQHHQNYLEQRSKLRSE